MESFDSPLVSSFIHMKSARAVCVYTHAHIYTMPAPTLSMLMVKTLESNSILFVWLLAYVMFKVGGRIVYRALYKTCSWDFVCLCHNLLSVIVGCMSVWSWELDADIVATDANSTCRDTISSPEAAVLMMQAVHCVSDFLVYPMEMMRQPMI